MTLKTESILFIINLEIAEKNFENNKQQLKESKLFKVSRFFK